MTKYLDKKFSVGVGSSAYRDNFDNIFGPRAATEPPPELVADEAFSLCETQPAITITANEARAFRNAIRGDFFHISAINSALDKIKAALGES